MSKAKRIIVMKISMKNTIQGLMAIAVGSWIPSLWAQAVSEDLVKKQEMVQKLFASVPLLPQNMRPFETLSFRYIEEKSTDNGLRWTVVKKGKVIFDIKKGHLKIVNWKFNPQNNLVEFEKNLRYKDKLYVYQYSFKGNSSFLEKNFDIKEDWDCDFFQISRCDNIQELYYIIMDIEWLSFWICKGETNLLIQDALGNKMLFDDLIDISFNDSSDEISLDYWTSRFTISKSRGVVTKKRGSAVQRTADRFISKKGLPIPLVINIDYPWSKSGSLLATRYRVTVDEKTLRINEQLEPSEFTITVPAGTRVSDAIKNKSYTLTAPLDTLDHTDSIKRLDAMLEEARKAK